jgi:hypothetical protein
MTEPCEANSTTTSGIGSRLKYLWESSRSSSSLSRPPMRQSHQGVSASLAARTTQRLRNLQATAAAFENF